MNRPVALSPGGHGPVAVLRCKGCCYRPGQACIHPTRAWLYSVELARPKRTPTLAQEWALDRAPAHPDALPRRRAGPQELRRGLDRGEPHRGPARPVRLRRPGRTPPRRRPRLTAPSRPHTAHPLSRPDLHGSTARFRLTISPTDERTDETVLPCNVNDPALALAAIHDLTPGDKPRVTGHLRLPRTPDEPLWLDVTTLAVLETAPLLTDPAAAVTTAVLERYGPYVCWFDADTDAVDVFTETGTWVGTAPAPDEIGDLLEAFEQRQSTSGE
ncbi:hypothetical protein R1Y80_27255 [Streptomyces sp. JL1001]|uniref:Uncharacterized protein n=1 Tax=Streptomyces sp. JL1001 TaxID=3078227 RepID=A0AAU8KMQ8_9ACTN